MGHRGWKPGRCLMSSSLILARAVGYRGSVVSHQLCPVGDGAGTGNPFTFPRPALRPNARKLYISLSLGDVNVPSVTIGSGFLVREAPGDAPC